MDEDHPEDDEEVDEPYDVERILEVKDNQEVSCSSLVYICDQGGRSCASAQAALAEKFGLGRKF